MVLNTGLEFLTGRSSVPSASEYMTLYSVSVSTEGTVLPACQGVAALRVRGSVCVPTCSACCFDFFSLFARGLDFPVSVRVLFVLLAALSLTSSPFCCCWSTWAMADCLKELSSPRNSETCAHSSSTRRFTRSSLSLDSLTYDDNCWIKLMTLASMPGRLHRSLRGSPASSSMAESRSGCDSYSKYHLLYTKLRFYTTTPKAKGSTPA